MKSQSPDQETRTVRARTLLCLVAVFLLGCVADVKPKTKAKVRTREELKEAVMNKSKEEVLKALGKPQSTGESGGEARWRYEGVSYDPVTKKTDDSVMIFFTEQGVVRNVVF